MTKRYISRRNFLKKVGAGAAIASIAGNVQSQTQRPNILFFFPDQQRPDWTGLNKSIPTKTPNIQWLADNGMTFSDAVCPSPLCAPSRSSLATGKEYERCGVPTNGHDLPEGQLTFYKLLRESGYHVTACGKFDLRKNAMDWGRDGKHIVNGHNYLREWGFSDGIDNSGKHDGPRAYRNGSVCPYFDYLERNNLAQVHLDDFDERPYPNFVNTNPTPLPGHAYADNYIAANGFQLLRQAPEDKPWFLQVNFNGPHEPMDITLDMKQRWQHADFPQPHNNTDYPEEKHVEIRQNYTAMIENIDQWLGRYIDYLESTGQLENTLIVYSSDHGEMLGDHNRWMKKVPYKQSAGVPLIVAGPGVKPATRNDKPTTILDLASTFLDYGNVNTPSDWDSRSLRSVLNGASESNREFVKSGLNPWRMVMNEQYKLIVGFDRDWDSNKIGPPKKSPILLFDRDKDPWEDHDISKENPGVVNRLRKLI